MHPNAQYLEILGILENYVHRRKYWLKRVLADFLTLISLFKKCTYNEDPKIIKMISCQPNALCTRHPSVKPSTKVHDHLK